MVVMLMMRIRGGRDDAGGAATAASAGQTAALLGAGNQVAGYPGDQAVVMQRLRQGHRATRQKRVRVKIRGCWSLTLVHYLLR